MKNHNPAKKYDMTYKEGNTTVNIVAPPRMTEEEIEKVLEDFHKAGWMIVKSLRAKGIEI
ncbi:hypothetical protein [Brevibacillus daliensis]|uniref:hypothetical protein n=1 Tax=Brevibacillus daliensis TaxID=2892995 RepID=UPI001E354E31|nr:hypothetical protein [Brevibacillus daliensis]